MNAYNCKEQIKKRCAESRDLEAVIHEYRASIPTAVDRTLPYGKLTGMMEAIGHIDALSAALAAETKSRIAPGFSYELSVLREQIGTIYCLVAGLFQSIDSLDKIKISYYFVFYELRHVFTIIDGFSEILVFEAKKPKPKMGELFPSFSETSLENLAESLSDVIPGNQISEQHRRIVTSFNEADLKILLEMRRSCDGLKEFFREIRAEFTSTDTEVSLFG